MHIVLLPATPLVDAHFIDKIEENKYPGPKCLWFDIEKNIFRDRIIVFSLPMTTLVLNRNNMDNTQKNSVIGIKTISMTKTESNIKKTSQGQTTSRQTYSSYIYDINSPEQTENPKRWIGSMRRRCEPVVAARGDVTHVTELYKPPYCMTISVCP